MQRGFNFRRWKTQKEKGQAEKVGNACVTVAQATTTAENSMDIQEPTIMMEDPRNCFQTMTTVHEWGKSERDIDGGKDRAKVANSVFDS